MNSESVYKQITKDLKQFYDERKFRKAVIGISGGIDSALTLKLAVDALGAENVVGILMPETGVTKGINITHAKGLCEFFGVETFTIPINKILMEFAVMPWTPTHLSQMNLKPRIRMIVLYNYANSHNAVVLGTSNKSEILLGYGTKFGDLAADIEVIGDLYKTEVYELSDHLELPREIIEKKPTAELYNDQTDEKELGASYSELDVILKKRDLGQMGLIEHGINPVLIQNVFERIEKNTHKSELPYVIEVNKE